MSDFRYQFLLSALDKFNFSSASCNVLKVDTVNIFLSSYSIIQIYRVDPRFIVKVSQSCPTLCNPMDCIVHRILQARILEWVACPFPRGSSQPRDRTQVSCIAGGFFYQLNHKLSPSNQRGILNYDIFIWRIFTLMITYHCIIKLLQNLVT